MNDQNIKYLTEKQVSEMTAILTLTGTGKCEGRKSWKEKNLEVIKLAKKLGRKNPKTGFRRSRRQIACLLYESGYKTNNGSAFGPEQIRRFLAC